MLTSNMCPTQGKKIPEHCYNYSFSINHWQFKYAKAQTCVNKKQFLSDPRMRRKTPFLISLKLVSKKAIVCFERFINCIVHR